MSLEVPTKLARTLLPVATVNMFKFVASICVCPASQSESILCAKWKTHGTMRDHCGVLKFVLLELHNEC